MKAKYLLLILALSSCSIYDRNDVYKFFPINSSLTEEILNNSIQIIKNKTDIIIVYNISKDVDRYSPHLLFYNQSLKLMGASYFPSEYIESVNNDTINAYVNLYRLKRKSAYRNDFPKKYSLNLKIRKPDNGYGSMFNKIIDSIKIDKVSLNVQFYLSVSENPFEWDNMKSFLKDTTIYRTKYKTKETLNYSLSSLHFFKSKEEIGISTMKYQNNGSPMWDKMFFLNPARYDNFINELWLVLKK